MEIDILEYWTFYLNIIACLFCSVMMIYLVIRASKQSRKKRQMSFDEQVFLQGIIQETELSFNRIKETIQKERNLLYTYLKNGQIENVRKYIRAAGGEYKQKGDLGYRKEKLPPSCGGSSKYAEAMRLADIGVDARNISQKVNMAKGEVELLMKLRKDLAVGHNKAAKSASSMN